MSLAGTFSAAGLVFPRYRRSCAWLRRAALEEGRQPVLSCRLAPAFSGFSGIQLLYVCWDMNQSPHKGVWVTLRCARGFEPV